MKKAPRVPARRRGKAVAGEDQHFRLLADCATEYAVFMLDAQGCVADWNAGAQRIHGYAESEIVGRHVGLLFTPEDRAQDVPARALEEAKNSGRSVRTGFCLRNDARRIPVRAEICALRDPAGLLTGFGHVTRDLSEAQALDPPLTGAPGVTTWVGRRNSYIRPRPTSSP